jgi:hypothetical protein
VTDDNAGLPAAPIASARLRRRWLALRNRILASPRFQRWAAGFLLTRSIAQRCARASPMRGHRCLLDLGGGGGIFLATATARWPHLELRLFDLPSVAEQARAIRLSGVDRAITGHRRRLGRRSFAHRGRPDLVGTGHP